MQHCRWQLPIAKFQRGQLCHHSWEKVGRNCFWIWIARCTVSEHVAAEHAVGHVRPGLRYPFVDFRAIAAHDEIGFDQPKLNMQVCMPLAITSKLTLRTPLAQNTKWVLGF